MLRKKLSRQDINAQNVATLSAQNQDILGRLRADSNTTQEIIQNSIRPLQLSQFHNQQQKQIYDQTLSSLQKEVDTL